MSGAEASVVLGVISSIITIVDKSKAIFDAVKDAKGQPEAFREVAQRLPIVHGILVAAETRIKEDDVGDESCKEVEPTIKACKSKAKKLQDIFNKALPAPGAPTMERYIKAVKMLGKENKVESLMKGILEDVQLLTSHQILFDMTPDQEEQLGTALADVTALEPSIPEQLLQDSAFTNILYGDGSQYNSNAGHQYINPGPGKQFNAETIHYGKDCD
jgi:hypothetical protein